MSIHFLRQSIGNYFCYERRWPKGKEFMKVVADRFLFYFLSSFLYSKITTVLFQNSSAKFLRFLLVVVRLFLTSRRLCGLRDFYNLLYLTLVKSAVSISGIPYPNLHLFCPLFRNEDFGFLHLIPYKRLRLNWLSSSWIREIFLLFPK